MATPFSQSEENGIKSMPSNVTKVYSVGVSTAGTAEMRMAKANPNRKIIATTIDTEGADFANKYIKDEGFASQVTIKIEDVTGELPYPDNFYEYVYARLVLHYLPKAGLTSALANLNRILKPGGKIFIVVRSVKAENFSESTASYDEETGFTTFLSKSDPSVKKRRFFHTPESISGYVTAAGFHIQYITEHTEKIYTDFNRTVRPNIEPLIELLAVKPPL